MAAFADNDTKEEDKDGTDPADQVRQLLREKEFTDAMVFSSDDKVYVLVEWGDWKHDHAYLDYLMKEAGWTKITEVVTEEDGSDCYSAEHLYRRDK